MKYIFDYTYYRIAKFYFKRDGLDAFTALITISLIMFLYLLAIFFIIEFGFLGLSKRSEVSLWEKGLVLLIMFLIFMYNKKRYNGKYQLLREKWNNESRELKIKKGIFVVLFIISPIIVIATISTIFT